MERLKELRKEIGLSQTSLALKFNTSMQVISRYERGDREPSYDILINLANFFGVSVDYLIGASDYRQPAVKTVSATLTPDENELLTLFRDTDDDGRSFLLMCAKRVNSQSALTRKKI